MKTDNPFDQKLKINKHIPDSFRVALVNVADTLDFCEAIAQSVFEERATPEHAISICSLVMQERLAHERGGLHPDGEELQQMD
ncbi:MAG: hypothetical protein ACYCT9_12805 [Leptospirillum sp.]